MALPLISAGIGAASSFLGGLLGKKANEKAQANSDALQREFAQHGVRWRVEDAKQAGLHPLYALQAQGLPQASPIVIPDSMGPALSEAGQHISSGIMARGSRSERQAEMLQYELLKKQLQESDARIGLLNSQAALARHEMMAAKGIPSDALDLFTSLGGDWSMIAGGGIPGIDPGAVSVKGATMYPSAREDSSTIGGLTPLWREFIIGDGRRIALPGGATGDAAEVLESVSESLPIMLMVYQENVRRFGPEWGDWFFDRYVTGGPKDWISDRLREFFSNFRPGTVPVIE